MGVFYVMGGGLAMLSCCWGGFFPDEIKSISSGLQQVENIDLCRVENIDSHFE
jgi:hypothetical protein